MIREEIWWPDECIEHEEVVKGDGEHRRMGQIQRPDDHLYTFKQTRTHVIWACACGQTLSRRKP